MKRCNTRRVRLGLSRSLPWSTGWSMNSLLHIKQARMLGLSLTDAK